MQRFKNELLLPGLLALFGLSLSAPSPAQDMPVPAPSSVRIPLPGADWQGGELPMAVLVYRPPGLGPFPVLVFAHGRSGDPGERARLQRPLGTEQLRFWLGQGVAVVTPIRVGYGDTGGPDAESSGAQFAVDGQCIRRPDFKPATTAGRRSTEAVLGWLRQQPWADASRVLLAGQSAGGFIAMASSTRRPAGVVGAINFAGGMGGNPTLAPGRPCDPDQLERLYAEFGHDHPLPTLWLYAANDQFWGEEAPRRWFDAFQAGNGQARWVQAPPVANGDGHGLSRQPRALWAPTVQAFLDQLPGWRRATPAAPAAGPVATPAASASPPSAPVDRSSTLPEEPSDAD